MREADVARPPSPAALVDQYETLEVSGHPFFATLARRPVDLGAIWLLMANLEQGISGHFVQWLAATIARLDDPRMSCMLAKQLSDELGNGDVLQIHSVLLDRFIAGLEPWRPTTESRAQMLEPGRRLADTGARPFSAAPIYEAIGALVVGEVFAKKMDHCVGHEIRRQSGVSTSDLRWLTLHETLEVDHADESRELALLVPEGDANATSVEKGARAQWGALWDFVTEVQQVAERVLPR